MRNTLLYLIYPSKPVSVDKMIYQSFPQFQQALKDGVRGMNHANH